MNNFGFAINYHNLLCEMRKRCTVVTKNFNGLKRKKNRQINDFVDGQCVSFVVFPTLSSNLSSLSARGIPARRPLIRTTLFHDAKKA